MNPLRSRLAAVRRRLLLVVTCRGLCRLVTLLLVAGVVAGWLDWRVHLPGLVRAVVLAATLGGAGFVAFRSLLRPLAAPADDLSLALRLEGRYPFLKDALASTVQFLERPDGGGPLGSEELRREVVQQSLRRVQYLDFRRVVDTRGLRSAGLSLAVLGGLAVGLVLLYPGVASTALGRLANPFGGVDWPRRTHVEVRVPARLARGEPVEVLAVVRGEIPAQALVEFDGLPPARQPCNVLPGKEPGIGTLAVRRDRAEKSFRVRVQANDAASPWYEVRVLPPPVLAPLGGRPSPQVHLRYPAYTDLPEQDLPDGSGNIDAVAGTVVNWRGAADRPVTRAWIEYRPEHGGVRLAGFLASLSGPHPAGFLASFLGGREVWQRVPLRIDADGRGLAAEFLPRITGVYAVHLEDESGLGSVRLFDLRVFRDPEPVVTLERPGPAHDSLDLLPGAEFRLEVTADDLQFALRSVDLEYRCRPVDAPRRLPLYDHASLGRALPQLLAGFAGATIPTPDLRLRPQRLHVARRLALARFKRLDGSPLREGDVLTLQVRADDFDDVAVDKKPGRSHEVRLRVVSRSALESLLNEAQTRVQQEIVRLRKMQQEALQGVIGPEQQWRNTGRLRDRDVDQLLQAEQLQQQIRARVGDLKEGLQAEVARTLRTMRDNNLPRSGAQERMETVAGELDRLGRKELNEIEPRLTRARKEKDGSPPPPSAAEPKSPLTEARQHQEEVEATLGGLLKLLEPWGSLNEIKGEAQKLLQEQRKLQEETGKLDKEENRGKPSDQLGPDEKAALDKAAELQAKLAERTAELLGKMDRAGTERRDKDPALAEALREAARQGRRDDPAGQMKNAGQKVRENQLQEAGESQRKAAEAVQGMVQSLEEHREQELDRLRKKLKEAEAKMADLARRQDALRKKIREAGQIADPEKRTQELKRLAREQEQLRQKAKEMVRELTRLRMERAARAAEQAGDRMGQAGQQLDQGQEPEDAPDEALDQLNEARRQVQREQAEVEEELAREKLAKVADQIKRLKERQEAALAEAERIGQSVLQKKGWDRGLLVSQSDLGENQKELAGETEALTKGKLAGAQVFARILGRAAEAMRQAADALEGHFEKAKEDPEGTGADAESPQRQREAVRRIAQLLEALKPEKGAGQRSPAGDGVPEAGAKAAGGGGEDLGGLLAQLKGLRILQQDVNERTEAFGKRHPDPMKIPPDAQRELQSLRQEQQEIGQMLDELTKQGAPEGGNP